MDTTQIQFLDTQLQDIYGEKWPGLTPGMAKIWLEELRRFESHIVTVAVTRWGRKHTFRVPGIDDLVPLAIEIDDAQQLERSRELTHARQAQSAAQALDYSTILDDAANNGPHDRRRWARLHVEMFRKGVCAPGHYDEAAALCEIYAGDADTSPEDARSWVQEAAWWRGEGTTRPIMYKRQPGEEG